MKKEILYVVGIGPGDPELLTIKAQRILRDISCIVVPKGKEDGSSLALSIVSKVINIDTKEILEAHFPMVKQIDQEIEGKWDAVINTITNGLNKHNQLAFITLGDPSIYSTFFYIYEGLKRKRSSLEIIFIPGISSINASACLASMALALGNEKLAVIPATYTIEQLSYIIDTFETVVFMKVHRVFDKILALLRDKDLLYNAIYIARVGMEGGKIIMNLLDVDKDDLNYFSLIILKKGEKGF
ncbi:MAG TPA: precorrin-2 C(20)-methyltransferase [Nitrospirae bacterium]|nr:precorrin-2 C(20)-methyltransferase [Nitrospirota bacterium]